MISNSEENKQESLSFPNKDSMKRKRRSKHEQLGRSAKCKHCDKTYLSSIALNNHIKTKHSHLSDIVTRGRGRPRKGVIEDMNGNIFETKYKLFFENKTRKRLPNDINEDYDLDQTSRENFKKIYNEYKGNLFKDLLNPEDFPLNHTANPDTCDYVFKKYIEYMHKNSNKEYFNFAYKFIVLFRESLNISKSNQGLVNFSSINNAETVPDSCNDFVGEFLEVNDNFNMDIDELIEIIQHCCQWLWENGYTTSKLSLISN